MQSVFYTLPACLALSATEPQRHLHELPQSTTKHGLAGPPGVTQRNLLLEAGLSIITNARADQQVQLLSHSPGSFGIKNTAIFKLQPCLNW